MRWSYGPVHLVGHDDANDNAVQSEGTSEDLHDQHAHKRCWGLCVGQRGARSNYSDGDAAEQVGKANDEAGGESHVSGEFGTLIQLGGVDVDVTVGQLFC